MKMLVTGAAGFIGSRFCAAAQAAGHEVRAMLRPRHGAISFPAADIVYGELPFAISAGAFAGIDALVHCAAATTGQGSAESEAINVDGTRTLLEHCRQARTVQRIVFLTSQSAHEAAQSAYGITKLAGERLVREGGIPYAILRPGLVFGPGKHGLFYRMRQSVANLPVLPLIGGGKAWVQAIEVGDLCEAMLRAATLPAGENIELNLGETAGCSLRDFLQAVAVAERGKPKPQLVIPTGPIKLAVGMMEKLHLPTPISSDNIRGMELVRKMKTSESLQRIGLTLKPFDAAMKEAVDEPPRLQTFRPVRVLLIGAGKIGIVHALNLTRREGVSLVGIVDHHSKAFGLYKSMGFHVPFHTHLNDAIQEGKPDAAVIATPAATHLPIARECLERGLSVLVEKPMAVTTQSISAFEELCAQHPNIPVHFGYMAAQFPHLAHARNLLQQIGTIRSFHGFSLQSHIMAATPVRWEMLKAQAGGGVLINFGCHVLSILFRLLGMPQQVNAHTWPIYSTEVEDAAVIEFDYADFKGRTIASWSIPDYPRPLNRLVIDGDNGSVVIENFSCYLERDGKAQQLETQNDKNIGYNAAPDYTGGGFSVEHANLARETRSRFKDENFATAHSRDESWFPEPVRIEEAARVERFVHTVYDTALKTAPATLPPLGSRDSEMARVLERIRR